MTTKHTPTPWFFVPDEQNLYSNHVCITTERRLEKGITDIAIVLFADANIDSCSINNSFHEQQIANAHLIAAAPELLSFVIQALSSGTLTTYHARLARQAIAKATGESK